VPQITTAELALEWKKQHPKDKLPGNALAKAGINISFASTGLAAVSCDTN